MVTTRVSNADFLPCDLTVQAEDWDDTLCPTSWVFDQIRRCPDNKALAAVEKRLGASAPGSKWPGGLPGKSRVEMVDPSSRSDVDKFWLTDLGDRCTAPTNFCADVLFH